MILSEFIEMKWTNFVKSHYINLNYVYTKLGDTFMVKIEDLPSQSNKILNCLCDYCGLPFMRSYGKILRGRSITNKDSCDKCISKKHEDSVESKYGVPNIVYAKDFIQTIGRKRIDENVVRLLFESRNYTMIGRYITAHERIEYLCNMHKDRSQFISYSNLKSGRGCRFCKSEKLSSERRKYADIEPVRKIFESKGCILLSQKYINVDEMLEYICERGHLGTVSLYNFENDNYCITCRRENLSGDNHWNWKGGITSDNEKIRKSKKYIVWRDSVYERDDFTCQCCFVRGKILNAHHIENFVDNPELRLDINNGITLCEDCHSISKPKSFHSIYTQFNNTKDQLIEYIMNKRNELDIKDLELPLVLQ